jgi:hypothetical protein
MVLVTLLVSVYVLSVNHVISKTGLLKFVTLKLKISLNLAYILDCEKHNKKMKANGYIVSCLTDAVCYLSQREVPFKGYLENRKLFRIPLS